MPDGRFLARSALGPGETEQRQSILVLTSGGAPAAGRRKRRKPREAAIGDEAGDLAFTRATAVRAWAPLASEEEAARWLEASSQDDEATDELIAEGGELVNRALHVAGIASGDAYSLERSPWSAAAIRIGFGTGDEMAYGHFTQALEIDFRSGSGRRRAMDELRPQERVAAILGDREQLDACETLIARAERDLEAGRLREAALQLRVGLEALLVEMQDAMADPDHEADMAVLAERRKEAGVAANEALKGDPSPEAAGNVAELIGIAARVIRRRRVLQG